MLEHGGGVRIAARRYGIPLADWIDLSTGINPYSWPVPPIPAAHWQRLPEMDDGLEAAAMAYYGTPHLLPVAGSQAALQTLPLLCKTGRVGMFHPSYAEHAHAWRRAGHTVALFSAETIGAAIAQLDNVVLVHPNNPTGARFSLDTLRDWRAQLAQRGGMLIVDEAFMDATPDQSLVGDVGDPGLIVLRSLGKFFGLAGARVGFMCAMPTLLTALQEQLGPWTITGPSRWIAAQALADRDWQRQTIAALSQNSARLAALLHAHGLPVAGGTALFQWIPVESAPFWQVALAQQGILVRAFTDPPGLRCGLPVDAAACQRLTQALAQACKTA